MAAVEVNGHANGVNGQSADVFASSGDDFVSHTYDYVICGGGTAGLVLAARLTENPEVTVGVLEAGAYKKDDPLVDTPGALFSLLGNPEYDWIHHTVPQRGNKNIVHSVPRGKALGGSSAINYMMYVRGSDADFDDWAALANDEGWRSEVMKGYMRKHQTLEPMDPAIVDRTTMPFVSENHGTSGPVRTSFNDTPPLPVEAAFVKACDEVSGYDKKPLDPWSGDHIGFFNTLGAVVRTGPHKGKRSYAARGYLGMALGRPNLHILCEALVNKVNLEGNKCVGANFTHAGRTYDVPVRREVIVSCGTIQSPQILELSGIGDPEVLKKAGIEPKVENKDVGNNFQDHVLICLGYDLQPGVLSSDVLHQPEVMAAAQKALAEHQAGPLTGIASAQGFLPYKLCATPEQLQQTIDSIKDTMAKAETDFQRKQYEQIIAQLENDKSANLQVICIPAKGNFVEGVQDQSKLFPGPKDLKEPCGFTAAMALQYPVSRGSIHISSADPKKPPTIDPGYLTHPADVAVLASGTKFLDKVMHSAQLQPMLSARTHPAPEIDLQDDAAAQDAVRDWCHTEYHPCGSVAMGAALDSRLRVKGVEGLRVSDASAFPNNVSGNICSSVYALAEKTADLLKEDWDYAPLSKKAA